MSGVRVLAVIPARGGSRGLPRKNLCDLHGHPLLAYSVASALASRAVHHTLVSTEDAEVAAVAKRYGAEVVARPAELATDEAPTPPVILHALELAEAQLGGAFDLVATLQPTSPLRLASDVDAAVDLLAGTDDPDTSVTSVVRVHDAHPARMSRLVGGYLEPFVQGPAVAARRQDLEPVFHRNGAIYLARRATVVAGAVWARRVLAYEMPPERSVNIDGELDLLLANAVLQAGMVATDLPSPPAAQR